jgi:hypothetical protein
MLSVIYKPYMLSVILLNVVMLSVIMLSVVMQSVIMQSVIMQSVVMLNVIMLSVVMLTVIMLSVVMLSVVAPFRMLRSRHWVKMKEKLGLKVNSLKAFFSSEAAFKIISQDSILQNFFAVIYVFTIGNGRESAVSRALDGSNFPS